MYYNVKRYIISYFNRFWVFFSVAIIIINYTGYCIYIHTITHSNLVLVQKEENLSYCIYNNPLEVSYGKAC